MAQEEQPRDAAAVLVLIVEAFEKARRPGLPKVAQLTDALLTLITTGALEQDAKLPGERDISAAINISLGTVQRSLNQMMADGDLAREHGRGTFVRQSRRALHGLWHYRFRDKQTGTLLPVHAEVISRSIVEKDELLAERLGPSDDGYVRISRLIRIDDRFRCWSDMFLSATRFSRLLDLPLGDLESVNLKRLLSDEFAAPTLSVDQSVLIRNASDDMARHMMLSETTTCLLLQIVARSRRNEPISFQQIYAPPVEFELELSEEPSEPARSLAA